MWWAGGWVEEAGKREEEEGEMLADEKQQLADHVCSWTRVDLFFKMCDHLPGVQILFQVPFFFHVKVASVEQMPLFGETSLWK